MLLFFSLKGILDPRTSLEKGPSFPEKIEKIFRQPGHWDILPSQGWKSTNGTPLPQTKQNKNQVAWLPFYRGENTLQPLVQSHMAHMFSSVWAQISLPLRSQKGNISSGMWPKDCEHVSMQRLMDHRIQCSLVDHLVQRFPILNMTDLWTF